jgi:DNA-binding CsgD family transcriptional regulator
MIGRERELTAADGFLDSLTDGAAALVLEGEPGIGKTRLWAATIARAEQRDCRVLSCRPAEAEARLSYAALADLLSPVEEPAFRGLPRPQRRAIEAALLRADTRGERVDQRAVSAAVASLLVACARERPLVLAIDDVQWLDSPSARVLAYAVRRFDYAPVGVLVSVRSDGGGPDPLALDHALTRVRRLGLGPLSLGALRQIVTARLGFSPSRPLLLRIERRSGGNPFFALALAEALAGADAPMLDDASSLPERLMEVLAARIEKLTPRTREALLHVSALAKPTLAVIEKAGQPSSALEEAEAAGVVEIREGNVRFAHPLFASALYSSVTAARRRALHRRLAAVVVEPEERARHLALAADRPDARVAAAVERAAARARARAAPDAAADLLEQALRLTPPSHARARHRRSLAAAEDYFYAGDRGRARDLLDALIAELPQGALRVDALRLLAELRSNDDSVPAAVPLLEEALALAGADAQRRARVELGLSYAYLNLGDAAAADRHAVEMLRYAESAGRDGLFAQALARHAALDVVLGRGVDAAKLERALTLEDWEERTLLPLRPSWTAGQAYLVTGQVERAHSVYAELRANLIARGLESDLPATAWMSVLTECLRGDLAQAERLAEEAVTGSLELESRTTRVLALGSRALVGAYRGAVKAARRDGEEALEIVEEIGWTFGRRVCLWPLGLLALSAGDAAEADRLLGPLAGEVASMGLSEPMVAPYLPDAVEALLMLGELEQAERLLEPFEQNGRALDRPWALATGARCRALLLAGKGDLQAAVAALERALAYHGELQMPFELGRTLLVAGQIQRRLRQKRAARESLEQAETIFHELGTPLWAAKASSQLGRLGLRRPASAGIGLTQTEKRVAALAASGLTNREIAAQLFISPKTVQANLAKVYEKLGIHSRAELGARAGQLELLQT